MGGPGDGGGGQARKGAVSGFRWSRAFRDFARKRRSREVCNLCTSRYADARVEAFFYLFFSATIDVSGVSVSNNRLR